MTDTQVRLVEIAFQMIQVGAGFTVNRVPINLRTILETDAEYRDIVNEVIRLRQGWQSVARRILRDAICRRGYFASPS